MNSEHQKLLNKEIFRKCRYCPAVYYTVDGKIVTHIECLQRYLPNVCPVLNDDAFDFIVQARKTINEA